MGMGFLGGELLRSSDFFGFTLSLINVVTQRALCHP